MPNDSLLRELLSRATSPIVPEIGQAGAAAEARLTEPSLTQSPNMARLKGFAGGALKGAGRLASDMTSPLALMGMATGSGGLGSRLFQNAAGSAIAGAGGAETPGHIPPEFTAVGDEALYNAGRPATAKAAEPLEKAYMRILMRGGR